MIVLLGIIAKFLLLLIYGGFIWGLVFLAINIAIKIINKKMHWEARALLSLMISGYVVVTHFAYLERVMI